MRKLKNSELDRLSVEAFKEVKKTPLIIVLDNIRSLNNIGSVFRTSDAFLIEKIYLCGITATPPHKDIHKTALGSTETVAWEYVEDTVELIQKLKASNIKILSIEQAENATMLNHFSPEYTIGFFLSFCAAGVVFRNRLDLGVFTVTILLTTIFVILTSPCLEVKMSILILSMVAIGVVYFIVMGSRSYVNNQLETLNETLEEKVRERTQLAEERAKELLTKVGLPHKPLT